MISLYSEHELRGGTMKKQSFVWLSLILSLLLSLVTACGVGSSQKTNNSQSTEHPAGNQLYVLDNYTGAGQDQTTNHIVALPADTANPTTRLMLPAGLTDLKHQRLYIADSLSNGSSTKISIIDTNSGGTIRTFNIPGSY